jgi:hypothetical protein
MIAQVPLMVHSISPDWSSLYFYIQTSWWFIHVVENNQQLPEWVLMQMRRKSTLSRAMNGSKSAPSPR